MTGLSKHLKRNAEVYLWVFLAAAALSWLAGCTPVSEAKAEEGKLGNCVVYTAVVEGVYVVASPNCHIAVH